MNNYFPHDLNARNDQKILNLRARYSHVGYSVFWMLLESMADEKDGYIYRSAFPGLSLCYGLAMAELIAIVDYCIEIGLLKESAIGIYSDRMMEHKAFRSERSASGKHGADVRWHKNNSAMAHPMLSKGKEKKINRVLAVSDEQFIADLKSNPVYAHINIDNELGKMDSWLVANPGRKKSRKFVVNWLNRIEKPLETASDPYIRRRANA